MDINHQFIKKEYFFPNWDVNTLFIGTFNPECGEPLDYYYRRKSNGFWKILNKYNSSSKDLIDFEFTDLEKFMSNKKMGCIDVIKSVSFPSQDKKKICGKGYSDVNLFTVKNYTREYNFQQLKEYIKNKKITYVFSTWGNRCNPKEFRQNIIDLHNFCSLNGVIFIQLKSPSGRFKGKKLDVINSNWWTILDDLFN